MAFWFSFFSVFYFYRMQCGKFGGDCNLEKAHAQSNTRSYRISNNADIRNPRAISTRDQPISTAHHMGQPGAERRQADKRSSAHYGSEEREREQKNIPRSNMHPGRRLRAERARLKGFLRAATALLRWAITSAPCCLAPALALARLPPAFASCRLEGRR